MQITSDTEFLDRLLLRVADGECDAFESLYSATSKRVHSLVGRVVIDRAQSEEVAQEVFLHVWQRAGSFDPSRGHAMSWILVIARGRAIDRVRASQASRDREVRVAHRSMETPFDHVLDEVEAREVAREVRQVLKLIAPIQREALALAYLHGRTVAEIASIVGASESAVKARMRDGIIRLRRAMETENAA